MSSLEQFLSDHHSNPPFHTTKVLHEQLLKVLAVPSHALALVSTLYINVCCRGSVIKVRKQVKRLKTGMWVKQFQTRGWAQQVQIGRRAKLFISAVLLLCLSMKQHARYLIVLDCRGTWGRWGMFGVVGK